MREDAYILSKRAQIEAVIVEVEAMKTANTARIQRGLSLAYEARAYQAAADELKNHATDLMNYWREQS